MGQIRKRGEIYWVRYYRDGRRFEESSRSTKYDDAQRLLKIREGDIARGLPVSPKIGRLRFDEAADDVINDYTVNKKRSLPDLQCRIDRHLAPFFGGRRMASLTTSDVREYIAKRQRDTILVRGARNVKLLNGLTEHLDEERRAVSSGEINRELTALKRIFRLALQAGKLLAMPHIPMLKENNVRTGFFEPEEFRAVLKHLPEHLQPIFRFAYITGWRIPSEVLPLQWRQVDFERGEVLLDVGSTKNDEGRVFPMTIELRRLLRTAEKAKDDLKEAGTITPWVFMQGTRRVLCFYKEWRLATRAAGCPGRIPHDLRRTAVRNLVRAGVPERVAMKLTGHKTRSVFERYNIVSDADFSAAAARLDRLNIG